ncbi:MAG: hypothetical protein M4579_004763 [Chaenotheca gracillima]|nr:MAG: hypothetical protein M4579_004763 [Chaenotheca gracillima]
MEAWCFDITGSAKAALRDNTLSRLANQRPTGAPLSPARVQTQRVSPNLNPRMLVSVSGDSWFIPTRNSYKSHRLINDEYRAVGGNMEDSQTESQLIVQETPPDNVFIAPSIDRAHITKGESYSYYSPLPEVLSLDAGTECVLGVDEAGRGPVLGPMVYSLLYLPLSSHRSLLADTHHFDDSKVLKPEVRSQLMRKLCTASSDLHQQCGWAARVMSARDLAADMLKPVAPHNLNAQAMDATIDLIRGVLDRGVKVQEIYIDTIGPPQTYQAKLTRIFPAISITVAKKADSLYPCVSAASVCAKVTRDAALEVLYEAYRSGPASSSMRDPSISTESWGSGYPSDARCTNWLKSNMDPVFGWGNECRFSWGTAKDLLEAKGKGVGVKWPGEEDAENTLLANYLAAQPNGLGHQSSELSSWYGTGVSEEIF